MSEVSAAGSRRVPAVGGELVIAVAHKDEPPLNAAILSAHVARDDALGVDAREPQSFAVQILRFSRCPGEVLGQVKPQHSARTAPQLRPCEGHTVSPSIVSRHPAASTTQTMRSE